jgi:hypothetical protein
MQADTVDGQWIQVFSEAVAHSIRAMKRELPETLVACIAVDCHPWDGLLSLALLTAEERDADPNMASPWEMAAWHHFNFTARLPEWSMVEELALTMRRVYYASTDNAGTADSIFTAVAIALNADVVIKSLSELRLAEGFRFSVPHPDSDREYMNDRTVRMSGAMGSTEDTR